MFVCAIYGNVLWLDVSMKEEMLVHVLYSTCDLSKESSRCITTESTIWLATLKTVQVRWATEGQTDVDGIRARVKNKVKAYQIRVARQ